MTQRASLLEADIDSPKYREPSTGAEARSLIASHIERPQCHGVAALRQPHPHVLFYDIEGMGHAWPLYESIPPDAWYIAEYAELDYLDEAMRFFVEHPVP